MGSLTRVRVRTRRAGAAVVVCLLLGLLPAAAYTGPALASAPKCRPITVGDLTPDEDDPGTTTSVPTTVPAETPTTQPTMSPVEKGDNEDGTASGASGVGFGGGIGLMAPALARLNGLAASLAQAPPTTVPDTTTTVPDRPTTTVPPPHTTTTLPPTTTTMPEPTPTTVPETTTTVPPPLITVPETTTTVPGTTTVPPTTTTMPPTTTTAPKTVVPSRSCFVYPMTYPVVGESANVSPFGAARDGGARLHAGNDLMAARMSPVVAVRAGFVEEIEYGGQLSGTSVRIRHDDGWSSHYIHLNNDLFGTDDGRGEGVRPGLAEGDRVKRGELIGWVGDSGNAEGTIPHLHFELRGPGAEAVDPEPSLKAANHVKVSFDGPSPAFIDIAGHPQEMMINLLASAGMATSCGDHNLSYCPGRAVTGRVLREVVKAWQGDGVPIARLIPYTVPFDSSHLAKAESGSPTQDVQTAPTDTVLVTAPQVVAPADGAAGRDAATDEMRRAAAASPKQVEVATGCGQWRLCDQEAVTIEEVSAVVDGVLTLEPVPGIAAPNAPMLESVRTLTYHGVLSTCTDRPAALLGHKVSRGSLASLMTRAAGLAEAEPCDTAAIAEMHLYGGPYWLPVSVRPFVD